MSLSQQLSGASLSALSSLSSGQHAWCWLTFDSTGAATIIVPKDSDTRALEFTRQVQQVTRERGESASSVRGMLSRLPSGGLTLAVRQDAADAAAVHAGVCGHYAELPGVVVVQMRGADIVKAARSAGKAATAAPDPFADPFADPLPSSDDLWNDLF